MRESRSTDSQAQFLRTDFPRQQRRQLRNPRPPHRAHLPLNRSEWDCASRFDEYIQRAQLSIPDEDTYVHVSLQVLLGRYRRRRKEHKGPVPKLSRTSL